MSDQNGQKQLPPGGVISDLSNYIKLILKLMGDRRVNPFLKILPIGTLVYFIFPDIIPGPVDHALFVWLGSYLFIELCPDDVVEEHMQRLNMDSRKQKKEKPSAQNDNVVDAEFWEPEN